jgi:mandelate racemase
LSALVPSIAELRVRALEVPMAQPVETAAGPLRSAPVVLLDLRTPGGAVGRSYLRTYTPAALRGLAALCEDLGELAADGTDLHAALRLQGTRGLVGAALAGLDMALWDASARERGESLASLLGAAVDRVPAYAGLRSRDTATAAEEAAAAAAAGFTAVKLQAGGRPHAQDAELVRALREAVGPDVQIMGDYNQSLGVADAVARAEELDALGLAWIEEPTRAHDLAGNARIAAALATPVQLGENLQGVGELSASVEARASDLLTLDAMKIGGVTGWREAAELARQAGLRVSSHTFPEFSVHLLAASPTRHWLEYLDHLAPIRARPFEIAGGYARVPDGPGAGLEWDEPVVARLMPS